MHLTAIIDDDMIEDAMSRWRGAFEKIGTPLSNGWQIWSPDFGVALSAGRNDSRYLYGLLDHSPFTASEVSIVEVNPPTHGHTRGQNQGVIAEDGTGSLQLLRRSQLSVPGKKAYLSDHRQLHKLPSRTVRWPDGKEEDCFLVCSLGSDDEAIVSESAAFMRGCKLVRLLATGGSERELAGVQNASFAEEAMGTFLRAPRDAQVIERRHGLIVNTLKKELETLGHNVSNDRVSRLGPDVYTIQTAHPYLFEIKVERTSSDYLKAVGQLLIYEQYLGQKYRKYLVIPDGLPSIVRDALSALDISTISFSKNGNTLHFSYLPNAI
jgi:hypothetical protein